jgi:hypothetical protein
LLQLVLKHEQAGLWRTVRLQQWVIYLGSIPLLAVSGVFFWLSARSGPVAWDVAAATAFSVLVLLASAAVLWLGHRRQSLRERGFGNTLREEIARNLSLVNYQLSRIGQTRRALFGAAPLMLASITVIWLTDRINSAVPTWFTVALILFVLVVCVQGAVFQSRLTRAELQPRRHRLTELLAMLNAKD